MPIPFFTTLDRYLMGQLAQRVFFGLIMFVVIWLAPVTLFKLTQSLFSGQIDGLQFVQMIGFNLPETIQKSMPMAVLFGSIFLFRRLSLSLELVNFFNAGISPIRLMVPVAVVGLACALLHFGVQEWVTPKTAPIYDAMRREVGMKEALQSNFTFVEKGEKNQWRQFLLIGDAVRGNQQSEADKASEDNRNHRRLGDFLILNYSGDAEGGVFISRIIKAAQGEWDKRRQAWHLFNGMEYKLNAEGVYQDTLPFERLKVTMSHYPYELLKLGLQNQRDMSWQGLSRYINLLESGGQLENVAFCKTLLQQKVALPLASLLFAILGAFVGMEKIRSRNQYSLLFAVVMVFSYVLATAFSNYVSNFGILPPVLVAWAPLIITVAIWWLLFSVRQQIEGA